MVHVPTTMGFERAPANGSGEPHTSRHKAVRPLLESGAGDRQRPGTGARARQFVFWIQLAGLHDS